jgi:hypothetical protein
MASRQFFSIGSGSWLKDSLDLDECFNNAGDLLASRSNSEIMHQFSHTRLARLSTRSGRFCFLVNSKQGGGLGV